MGKVRRCKQPSTTLPQQRSVIPGEVTSCSLYLPTVGTCGHPLMAIGCCSLTQWDNKTNKGQGRAFRVMPVSAVALCLLTSRGLAWHVQEKNISYPQKPQQSGLFPHFYTTPCRVGCVALSRVAHRTTRRQVVKLLALNIAFQLKARRDPGPFVGHSPWWYQL